MSSAENTRTILLFGKTGDGKSTLGNVLISGDLEGDFESGNSLEPVTLSTQAAANKETGLTVVDTVGLFSNVHPEADVQRAIELRNHLASTYGDMDVFCYVKKATKFTRADEACLKVFQHLFGKNHPTNVLLIFTSCKDGWLTENNDLITRLMGSKFRHRVGVDFPPHDGDAVVEAMLKRRRETSLNNLNKALELVYENSQPASLGARGESGGFFDGMVQKVKKALGHQYL